MDSKAHWKCGDCRVWLGPVRGTVASCPECRRAYVCVTAEEVAAGERARKRKRR